MNFINNDMRNWPNNLPASGQLNINSSDSGVVSKILGGAVRCRLRLDCGVSPVRVSMVISSPISSIGLSRFRAISTASALSGDKYSVCSPSKGDWAKSIRPGKKPDRVLPAPVGRLARPDDRLLFFDNLMLVGMGCHPGLEPVQKLFWQSHR